MRRALFTISLALVAVLALGSTASAATSRANLAATKLTVKPTTLKAGETISASATIANRGTKKARATKTFFILSEDDRRSGDDLRLASVGTGKLAKAKSGPAKFSAAVPASTAPGKYFLLACADGTRTVREKSERDNCKSQAITVTAAAPAPNGPPSAGPPAPTGPTGPPPPVDTDADGIPDSTDNCPLIANSDQADNDADAKGDLCDECPIFANPGSAFCAATVYDVRDGTIPIGSNIQISGLVVTAASGSWVWAQAPVGDAGYDGPSYSAIKLEFASTPALVPGNVITVGGEVLDGGRLEAAYSSVTGTNAVPAPLVTTGANLAPNVFAHDHLLVAVNSVSKVSTYSAVNWLVTDGTQFAVLNVLIGTLPFFADSFGQIIGIQTYDGTHHALMPRTSADVVDPG